MNSQFRNVAALYKRGVGELSHRQTVMRLYRNTLRCLLSWTMDRDLFLDEAASYRSQFDAEKNADSGYEWSRCWHNVTRKPATFAFDD